jgi:hypothetical protein
MWREGRSGGMTEGNTCAGRDASLMLAVVVARTQNSKSKRADGANDWGGVWREWGVMSKALLQRSREQQRWARDTVVSGAEELLPRSLIGSKRGSKGEFGFLRRGTSGSNSDRHRDREYLGLKLQPQICNICARWESTHVTQENKSAQQPGAHVDLQPW